MTVAIITDSAAAIPPDVAAAHDVTVVPMWLSVDGVAIVEGERSLEEVLRSERVTTAAPSPGEFEAAIKERLRGCDEAVVLTIASSMSATFAAASVAATAIGDSVRVVDTTTAAGAEALVVLAASAAARAGASAAEVEVRAREAARDVCLVAMLPTLDHLVRSGRVPGLAAWAGRRLGIAPMFEFRDGKVQKLRPALSVDAALDRMLARVRRSGVPGARLHVVALHALAFDTARRMLDRIEREYEPATAFVGEFGPVMVVHTGPGLVGLAWWWEDRAAGKSTPDTR